jgi:hypothetical protein
MNGRLMAENMSFSMSTARILRNLQQFRRSGILAGWALLAGGGLLCGCASTSPLAAPLNEYSTATAQASTQVQSSLAAIRTIDQKVQSSPFYITNHVSELRENSFPSFLGPEDLLQRTLAVQTLANYTAKLKELAGMDESKSLTDSATAAGEAIDSTATNIQQLAGHSSSAIPAGVVSGLASLAGNLVNLSVVKDRDRALQEALCHNSPVVSNICALLADELDPAKAGPIYNHVENDYRQLEEIAEKRFKSAQDNEKPAIVTDYMNLLHEKTYTLASMRNLAGLYRQIAETHAALAGSANSRQRTVAMARLSEDLAMAAFYNSQISTK